MKRTVQQLAREAAVAYKASDKLTYNDSGWRAANDLLWKAMDALAAALGVK